MKRSLLSLYTTPKKEIARPVYLVVSVLVSLALFGLWCALSYGGLVRRDFLPTPVEVVLAGIEGVQDGSLLINTAFSVGTILSAHRCVLLACGPGKASAVAAMLRGRVGRECPASALQGHGNALVVLDREAAGGLESGQER